MKTKLVYVLTSTVHDYYLEQALMSVYSARMHNPEACIALVTDTDTAESCTSGLRKTFLDHFNEVVVVDASAYDSMYHRSRYLKTTLRQHVKGDYLFIDGDTVVCEPLDEIDACESSLAFALDMHLEKENWDLFFSEKNRVKAFGTVSVGKHFNSGVSFVMDCQETHAFYDVWHEEWRKALAMGNAQDQPPLHSAMVRLDCPVAELSGVWNCQICGSYLPYLHHAKILHTFATASYLDSPCLFREHSLLQEIRVQGRLTDNVLSLLSSPKTAFPAVNMAIGREAIAMLKSPVVERTIYFHKHYRPLFRVMDAISCILRRLCDVMNWLRVHLGAV